MNVKFVIAREAWTEPTAGYGRRCNQKYSAQAGASQQQATTQSSYLGTSLTFPTICVCCVLLGKVHDFMYCDRVVTFVIVLLSAGHCLNLA